MGRGGEGEGVVGRGGERVGEAVRGMGVCESK